MVKTAKRIGVIDIGSNSIRLVIYDALKRIPVPIFNERILCGLARNMQHSGVLNAEGVEKAIPAIGRYIKMAQLMGVEKNNLQIFATAAVRDASNGKQFVNLLQTEFTIKLKIFSGEEEAKYAAYGVIAGIPNADGVAADLGGGSLELLKINKGKVKNKGASYPIGALRLLSLEKRNLYEQAIETYLNKFELAKKLQGSSFYAVGGAFRNLAKIHLTRKGYLLRVLHNYQVPVEDFLQTLKLVAKMSNATVKKVVGVPQKRLDVLPVSASVAEKIVEIGRPQNIIFSVFGVREGLLYAKLDDETRQQDPLITGCADMVSSLSYVGDYAYELEEWIAPIFTTTQKLENKERKRLHLAACILSEISRRENIEYRAELAFKRIIDSTLSGINHHDRIYIAKCVHCRYDANFDNDIEKTIKKMLTKEDMKLAKTAGLAMRLARSLSGCALGILPQVKLTIEAKLITLKFSRETKVLMGEEVEQRLSDFASYLGKDFAVSYKYS